MHRFCWIVPSWNIIRQSCALEHFALRQCQVKSSACRPYSPKAIAAAEARALSKCTTVGRCHQPAFEESAKFEFEVLSPVRSLHLMPLHVPDVLFTIAQDPRDMGPVRGVA